MAGRLSSLMGRYTGQRGQSPLADYSALTPEEERAPANAARGEMNAVRDVGMQQTAPQLEMPEVPDPEKFKQARDQTQLAGLAQGLLGRRTVTPYTAGHGDTGSVQDGPMWQAVRDQARNPWVDEQMRVTNANALHSAVNQYSMLKSGVDNKNIQQAFDLAQQQAAMKGTRDYLDQQTQMQREMLNRNQQWHEEAANRADRRANQTDTRIGMAEEAAKRATAAAELKQAPTQNEHAEYIHATGAMAALTNLENILQNDKGARGLAKGVQLTWGELRKNTSPQAQALVQQRDMALDHIGQMQRRMLLRGGSGATSLLSALGRFGDDQKVDLQLLKQLKGQADMSRKFVSRTKPNADYEGIDHEYFKDAIAPPGSPALGGQGGTIDDWLKGKGDNLGTTPMPGVLKTKKQREEEAP